MNLLSVGAAYGVMTLFAKGGAVGGLIGIDHEVPIAPFMPVMMFAILFGLSMDYEVFLISRIREEYLKDGDTRRAVADGLAKTARVITAAAAIMVVVFLAFLAAPDVFLKLFGIGLASAIFLDATARADGARARRDAAARRPQLVDPGLARADPAASSTSSPPPLARGAPQQHVTEHRDHGGEDRDPEADDADGGEDQADDGDEAGGAARQHQPVGALLALLACGPRTGAALEVAHDVRLRSRRDLAQVERLVERLLVDAVLARGVAQRAAARRGRLDDLRRLVVADERVERGRDGERALGGALAALEVGLDAVDALLGQQPSTRW